MNTTTAPMSWKSSGPGYRAYGLTWSGKGDRWIETMIVRSDGIATSTPTGVIYHGSRVAQDAIGAKNIAGGAVIG